MEILKEIQNRYSPRSFSEKPVEQEKLDALFEAARQTTQKPYLFISLRF